MASNPNPELLKILEVAEALYAGGKWQQARAAYDRALAVAPHVAPLYVQRGLLVLEKIGDVEAAKSDFDKAIELDARYGLAYYGRGWVRHHLGDFEGELSDAQRGLELDPDRASMYYLRIGSAFHGLKRHDEALQAYSRAIEMEPEQEGTIYNRGLLLLDMKRYDEALADFDRALELDPDWTWALDGRGNVLLERNDLDAALDNYDRWVRAHPDDGYAYLKRGLIRQEKGQREAATEDFKRALDFSTDPEVRSLATQQLRISSAWWRNGVFGLLTFQPHAYREVAEDKSETWRAALLVVGVGIIVGIVPLLLNFPEADIVRFRDRLVAQDGIDFDTASRLVMLIGLAAPLYWLALVGIIGTLARLFGDTPRYGALLRATGYASMFGLLSIIPSGAADSLAATFGFAALLIAITAAQGSGVRRAFGFGCAATIILALLIVALIVLAIVLLSPG